MFLNQKDLYIFFSNYELTSILSLSVIVPYYIKSQRGILKAEHDQE